MWQPFQIVALLFILFKTGLVICIHQLATGNFLYNRNDVYIDRVSFMQVILYYLSLVFLNFPLT